MSPLLNQPIAPFIEQFQSTILGTIAANGYPFGSYAPFYYDGRRIYIFVSDIATHTQNLQHTPKASCLFIQDESKSPNIFARKRITLQCDATKIPRESERYQEVMPHFANRHPTIEMLAQMQDFNLYALTPVYGEATFGFGDAYLIGGEEMNLFVARDGGNGHR
jgi:putative heme iron utilization protein